MILDLFFYMPTINICQTEMCVYLYRTVFCVLIMFNSPYQIRIKQPSLNTVQC